MRDSERVSQDVRAPFCILQSHFVREAGSPWPFFIVLVLVGSVMVAGGTWALIQALPEYSVPVTFMLFGGLFLLFAFAVFRTIKRDNRYWLGVDTDKLSLMQEGTLQSWPWAEVAAFRVTEATNSGFEVTNRSADGLDPRVDFVQSTAVSLFAPVLNGPPILVPVDRFMGVGYRERDRADNLCIFLNDLRERGLSGKLAAGAPSFLAPMELNIVPMRSGAPLAPSWRSRTMNTPTVRRQ